MGLPGEPGPPISAPDPLPTLWRESRNGRQRRSPRDLARLSCRPSSAYVSGSLRSPFGEPFWAQKCSLSCYSWSRGFFLLSSFSIDVCYARPLKFTCFGRCEKKAHVACDPQKLMFFMILHMRSGAGHAARKATEDQI